MTEKDDDDLGETTRDVLANFTPSHFFGHVIGIKINPESLAQNLGFSKQFDITRERIRQIEAKALKKLRHPTLRKSPEPDIDEDDSDKD